MNYEFVPPKLEKDYTNVRFLKKKYGPLIMEGMMKFLGLVEDAENAYDLKQFLFLFMEHKKGNLKDYYSISLDKKKSKWRLMIQLLDDNGKVVEPNNNEQSFLKSIKTIRIRELSDHYGEY